MKHGKVLLTALGVGSAIIGIPSAVVFGHGALTCNEPAGLAIVWSMKAHPEDWVLGWIFCVQREGRHWSLEA